MASVSQDVADVLAVIRSKGVNDGVFLGEIFTEIAEIIIHQTMKAGHSPLVTIYAQLSAAYPFLVSTNAPSLEAALNVVLDDCTQCRDSADCSCARHLKLFSTIRALMEQIDALKNEPAIKELRAKAGRK